MVSVGLGVPVYKNFEGFTKLMASVDLPVRTFIHNNWDENHGVSVGWNECIQRAIHANIDFLLISNDDVVFEPGAISTLLREFTMSYDLVTMTNTRNGDPGEGSIEAADFSCFMIRPEQFVEKFGWFDEKFSPAYFEDNDMAYRMRLLGGTYRQILHARMYHAGSVTQNWNGQPVVTGEMFETNRSYYAVKWGGLPGAEQYRLPYNGMTGKTPKDW